MGLGTKSIAQSAVRRQKNNQRLDTDDPARGYPLKPFASRHLLKIAVGPLFFGQFKPIRIRCG